MRVIGGIYRSRLLEWPEDVNHIRPTKDRIRESIFNALGDISDLTFLDLYSGSGAFAIEAISRGAKKAYFVDINPIALKTIRKNIQSLKIASEIAPVLMMRDTEAIEEISRRNEQVDIIFLDPPYKEGKYKEVLELAFEKQIIGEHTIIVLEADHYVDVPSSWYIKRKDYKYGEIHVAILWR